MYYTQNLRTNLEEWMARLDRAEYGQYSKQLQHLLINIKNTPALYGLVEEACVAYPMSTEIVSEWLTAHDSDNLAFPSDDGEFVSYCWRALEQLIAEHGIGGLKDIMYFYRNGDILGGKTDSLVRPIVHYLLDRIAKSSSVLYLLEKYKRRTEWFMKESLRERYLSAKPAYENILDEDLRLFLFDQGIDYPFSAPNSPSGRADIVGAINTSDPLVVEVKVLDKERTYGKERIRKGFNQVLKYTNDYSKDTGYLVIFNLDKTELNFVFDEHPTMFPPMITLNHKCFYFIVVNLADFSASSTHPKPLVIEVSRDDLLVPEKA